MAVVTKYRRRDVLLKRESQDIYRSDDMAAGVQSLSVKCGETYAFSYPKAKQILKDFPNDWSIIKCGSEVEYKELASSLIEGKVRSRPSIQQKIEKVETTKNSLSKFFENIKENTNFKRMTPEKLLDVVKSKDFIGVENYLNLIDVDENEIGANTKLEVRYKLRVDSEVIEESNKKEEKPKRKRGGRPAGSKNKSKAKKDKSLDAEDIPEVDSNDDDDDLLEDITPTPRASRDIDPEDDLNFTSDFDDLDDDLDPSDKHKKKK